MKRNFVFTMAAASITSTVTTVSGDYTANTIEDVAAVEHHVLYFTVSGDLIISGPDLENIAIELVGGGGSGGRGASATNGGGGSAGELEVVTSLTRAPSTYAIVVGTGGASVTVDNTPGNDGGSSTGLGQTALGGQGGGAGTNGGGAGNVDGQDGYNGSGGGASGAVQGTAGTGTNFNGGAGFMNATAGFRAGGGGAGEAGAGTNGVSGVGGDGGDGVESDFTDTPLAMCAGGGGAGQTPGDGGANGGGAGGNNAGSSPGSPTSYGSASGGGRSVTIPAGFNGLVRVRFPVSAVVEVVPA